MTKSAIIFKTILFLGLASCASLEVSQSQQQSQNTSPQNQSNCSEDEYRQLDFWLGEWDLSWDNGDGSIGTGTNSITQQPYGNCVIMENFDGAPSIPLKGMSVSTYHKPVGQWRQTWVDNTGGFFALHGGPTDDGNFSLELQRLSNNGPYRRMIWKNIKANSMDWHWQGRSNSDEGWSDLWVIKYSRK